MKLCSSGPAPTVSTGLKSESRMFHSSSKPEVPLLKLDLSAASRARRYLSANLGGEKDMEDSGCSSPYRQRVTCTVANGTMLALASPPLTVRRSKEGH